MKPYFLSPLILQKLIWIPTRLILVVFARLRVSGLENLKGLKGGVIFATNHGSELDPFLVPASLPFWSRFSPIFYASREKAFYDTSGWRQRFYGGLFFKAWGAYPVYVGLHDFEKSMVHHLALIRDGAKLCVFLEGGTSPDGTLQPAKGGVGFLAHQTGAAIVPVAFTGNWHIYAREFFSFKRHITVTFGKPMYVPRRPDGITPDECKAEAQRVMDRIGEMIGKNQGGTSV